MADAWAWGLRTGGPGGPGLTAGRPLSGGTRLSERRLLFARNRPAEARVKVAIHDPGTLVLFDELRSSLPLLVVYRDSAVRFAGHWMGMAGDQEVDASGMIEVLFKDAFALLDHRLTDGSVTRIGEDAGFTAIDLFETSEGVYGALPIFARDYEPTTVRDSNYDNHVIGPAIIALAELQGGFDWYPDYLEPQGLVGYTMNFHIVARQGSDRPDALFEYGAGTLENLRGYTPSWGLPINHARALGAGGLTDTADDSGSEERYGPLQVAVPMTDVADAATLVDGARDALRPDLVMVTQIKCDPAKSPQPWDDFWIGDTVRVNIDDGAVQQQLQVRVQTVEIALGDDDEMTDLIVGIDPGSTAGSFLMPSNTARRYVQQQRDVLRRLGALER